MTLQKDIKKTVNYETENIRVTINREKGKDYILSLSDKSIYESKEVGVYEQIERIISCLRAIQEEHYDARF